MQVATLFRETANLLGASMEAGGVAGNTIQDASPLHNTSATALTGVLQHLDTFSHPNTNKFSLNMKLETQDDGYETSADLMLTNSTNNHNENNTLKCSESNEDPYSFIDEDPMLPPTHLHHHNLPTQCGVPSMANMGNVHNMMVAMPKKRGRKKKIKNNLEPGQNNEYENHLVGLTNSTNNVSIPKLKERKKHDRFNGMPEEEVSKRTLPDHLATNLDIIIIGINPGLFAAYKGHHYAGPGNHFWKCLYLSGLTPEQMTADEDYKLLQVGIGFTNMVQRPTKGSADLTRKEIKEGCQLLLEKLQRFKPKIAVFNGKLIYEVFSGKKDFSFGRQPDLVDGTNTYMWVMPSSSARCAQLPRAADKVPFYAALKKFRDYLNGIVTNIDDSEVVFSDSKLKGCCDSESKNDMYTMDLMDLSNSVVKKDGDVIPGKKKRGRPKKIKTNDDQQPPTPKIRKPTYNNNNCDFPKKKRGRPKKIKCDEDPEPQPLFSPPSPIQSPTNFCHMTPPSYISSQAAPASVITYNHSPRPQSQPFTHSDLSSEISAAISSDHLGSPAPTSPSLGPPDFDPPTSMPEDTECRFSSPAPSTTSELNQQYHPNYHTFGTIDHHQDYQQPSSSSSTASTPNTEQTKAQDMSSKSLSGLESLVDQIPNIGEGESVQPINLSEYSNSYPQYPARTSSGGGSPIPYSYLLNNNNYNNLLTTSNFTTLTNNYGHTSPNSYQHNLMGNSFMEHMPPQMPLPAYPQLSPYGQQYSNSYAPPPGLHVPSPNYPSSYYNASYVQQPNSSTPGYLHSHMFERIRPDIGYGGF